LWGQACKVGGTLRGHCLVFHYKEARKPGERGASLAEVEEDTEEVNKGLRGLLGLLGYLSYLPLNTKNPTNAINSITAMFTTGAQRSRRRSIKG